MKPETKVALLIPTRGDRKDFLQFAHYQISKQKRKPDFVIVVDDEPKSESPDITYRYRIGFERAKEKGADLILCWEDDDWYHENYVEVMLKKWLEKGKPDLIGIDNTMYYQIFNRKFHETGHPGRASMFCTGISASMKVEWGDDAYSYTDLILWKHNVSKHTFKAKYFAIGIKHGIGLCGGGGHPQDWRAYSHEDKDALMLRSYMDQESFMFYENIAAKGLYEYKVADFSFNKSPFLSIVTRVYNGYRQKGFEENQKSIYGQSSPDFEQVFIIDNVGRGMSQANRSFTFVKDLIRGKYAYLLDDDDFLKSKKFVACMKKISEDHSPDIIFIKMIILTGDGDNIYPKAAVWETREMKRGMIGGSCFLVKKWIYDKYIHEFQRERMGDFNFINTVMTQEKNLKLYWHDEIMAETGKVSRGAKE